LLHFSPSATASARGSGEVPLELVVRVGDVLKPLGVFLLVCLARVQVLQRVVLQRQLAIVLGQLFFGRDEEIDTLYEMVFQTNIILVYGASGTGKTSLIQCGLASRFKSHDWLALNIRRGSNINQSFEKSLLDAGGAVEAEESEEDLDWLDDILEEETASDEPPLSAMAQSFKNIYLQYFKPIYLIFDQFEELYILGTKEEQAIFTAKVNEILTLEQPVRMIFSIREEYLGYLYEFEKAVPQLLQKKLRVEPMNLGKVREVIVGSTSFEQSNIRLAANETDSLTETIFNKIKGKAKTLTIPLPYLQVFLDKLYLQITNDESRQAEATFNLEALNKMGEIDDVLREFIEEQVLAISRRLIPEFPALDEDNIWNILSPLVTLEGTKEPIAKEELYARLEFKPAAIDATLEAFINSRIIRYNEEEAFYEIAHDALAKQIATKRSDEEIALLEVRRLIHSQSALNENAREMFSAKQLSFIEPFLEKLVLTPEEEQLIADSRKSVKAKRGAKRRRRFVVIGGITGVIIAIAMIGLAVYAFNQSSKAKLQTRLAKEQTELAKEQAALAKKAIAEKNHIEFKLFENRANIILKVGGCPGELLDKMRNIADSHQDSIKLRSTIQNIELNYPNCQ